MRLSQIARSGFSLTGLGAGRIFLSFDRPVNDAEPPDARLRYDKVEPTYPGAANLTAGLLAIPGARRRTSDSGNWLGKPPFAAARRAHPRWAAYNEYAAVIYRYSSAYGFSFSDTGPKWVQLPLDEPTLRITILPDRKRRR